MNAATSLPTEVGGGFKPEHARDAIEGKRRLAFFEVHAENYMARVGRRMRSWSVCVPAIRCPCMALDCRSAARARSIAVISPVCAG